MKKWIFPLVCFSIVFGLVFIIGKLGASQPLDSSIEPDVSPSMVVATASNGVSAKSNENDIKSNQAELNQVEIVYTSASLMDNYDDYSSIIADAEFIIIGTVKSSEGFINDQSRISSHISLSVDEVLKGKPEGDDLSYSVYGGTVSKLDYFEANADKLKSKFSPEDFEKQIMGIGISDEIENVFMGLRNAKSGDKLLVFISYSDIEGCYYVHGSSYYGQYFYDDAKDSFFRIVDGERLTVITYKELLGLVAEIPDNSKAWKLQQNSIQPVEKDFEITPRDPAFDKFKE